MENNLIPIMIEYPGPNRSTRELLLTTNLFNGDATKIPTKLPPHLLVGGLKYQGTPLEGQSNFLCVQSPESSLWLDTFSECSRCESYSTPDCAVLECGRFPPPSCPYLTNNTLYHYRQVELKEPFELVNIP
ncbi:hypothetical protein GF362_03335 [Candidatus Dojkabacteria bacterium]|nr:hypothetical protein [Candidatus Dojkabacteria bacterium]